MSDPQNWGYRWLRVLAVESGSTQRAEQRVFFWAISPTPNFLFWLYLLLDVLFTILFWFLFNFIVCAPNTLYQVLEIYMVNTQHVSCSQRQYCLRKEVGQHMVSYSHGLLHPSFYVKFSLESLLLSLFHTCTFLCTPRLFEDSRQKSEITLVNMLTFPFILRVEY